MAATLESTIVRLHRSGFPAAKIAKLVHVSATAVRRLLAAEARDTTALDVSFLPTVSMRVVARRMGALVAQRGVAAPPRYVRWEERELKLVRQCVDEGYTVAQISETLCRLGLNRTPDAVCGGAKKHGIQLNKRGRRPVNREQA